MTEVNKTYATISGLRLSVLEEYLSWMVEDSSMEITKNKLASVSSRKISDKNGARRPHVELICVIETLC